MDYGTLVWNWEAYLDEAGAATGMRRACRGMAICRAKEEARLESDLTFIVHWTNHIPTSCSPKVNKAA